MKKLETRVSGGIVYEFLEFAGNKYWVAREDPNSNFKPILTNDVEEITNPIERVLVLLANRILYH